MSASIWRSRPTTVVVWAAIVVLGSAATSAAQTRPWDPAPVPQPAAELPPAAPIVETPESLPAAELVVPQQPSLEELLGRIERLEQGAALASELPLAPPPIAEPVPPPAAPACDGCADAVKPLPAPASECEKCAGYDKGFYVRAPDGSFAIKVNGLFQPRYVANWRSVDAGDGDEDELGFVLARAPLIFSGNIINPQISYWIIFQGANSSGLEFIEEARVNYEFESGLFLQIGRMRNMSFMRELDVSYSRQMGVERSYHHAVFSTGVLEGICATKQNECLRANLFVTDGRLSGAQTAAKDFYEDATDFAVSSGVDWKLCGDWTQYGDFPSWPDEPLGLFIGADVHYENGETGDAILANDLNEFIAWTVDATLEKNGFMAFGSVVQRYSLIDEDDTAQTGLQALTAWQIVPDKLEPFFRYEYIDFGGRTNVGAAGAPVDDSSVNILSTGVNWYVKRHAFKITTELKHALDAIPLAAPATGFLLDPSGHDGQTVLLTQLQLSF